MKHTPNCLDWKICYRDPLPTWVSESHKIVLLGDSAHPHLPTSAQGASQATESAAVLALCLKFAGKGNVPLAVCSFRIQPASMTDELADQNIRKAPLCTDKTITNQRRGSARSLAQCSKER
jgi:hypothetical protein